jgi:hypothetical protein
MFYLGLYSYLMMVSRPIHLVIIYVIVLMYYIFSGVYCVMFHLLSLILIVLVKYFAATFLLQRGSLKSLSLVLGGTGLGGEP